MAGILQFLFPRAEGYDVVQETEGESGRPDFTAFKVLCKPGGTLYSYEYLLVESKRPSTSILAAEPQCHDQLANCTNESRNVYGMIQSGFKIQFYKHENFRFERLGSTLHLVDDVALVTQWARYLKANPLPFI